MMYLTQKSGSKVKIPEKQGTFCKVFTRWGLKSLVGGPHGLQSDRSTVIIHPGLTDQGRLLILPELWKGLKLPSSWGYLRIKRENVYKALGQTPALW